ncbi:MAG: hypothetical protein WA817_18990 [Candidatus Acidiferrum sp.]
MRPASILACALCAVLGVFSYFCGAALVSFAFVKWQFRNSPEIWIVPKPMLADVSTDRTGPEVAYFGYEFESPAPDVKEERKFESAVVLSFSDCAGMSIIKPGPSGDLIEAMQQEASKRGRNIQDVFGRDATRSSYAIKSKTLNLTPNDLHLFSSPREIVGNADLLIIKHTESKRFKNGLYSFATPWMRGFQEGDVQKDRGVVIEAFDHYDRRLMLIVGAKPGRTCFAQADLSHIIFSLRPVPANE